ncbi:YidC/Oxa1 family membrane protein insertase [Sedimentibacter acidaminivorans]|jgi:YidC/Oxa1 family membrane protein insertase|uniref:YidC/Oxa1 family membrane protein insertase n=1 Tax=Sedimentibacter acidaminivorans TaxID=913099 RepID=A0ABS4GFY8_9FIRM|nr:YidC/Oxa1 family membrane protein insertase [Sedimentibacter acidaminivorans]MBP1926295.1 YidC/Oxa1 family membrane protein insertase [Sedimentibacter acidaminivorans]
MNLDFICYPIGMLVKLLYNMVSILDTNILSAYAISIILATIFFKLILMPLTLKQTKSMKVMQELSPQIKEIQKKYEKDPQTLQRKQMELYKEANYNPMSGCLPMLIQMPILIAFFYVIRQPVQFIFQDQAFFDAMNKSFLWIKDLGYTENFLFENGTFNGLSMGGLTIPFIGGVFPILAIMSGYSTYLTSKMTTASQPSMNEQQASTQKTMTMMMPVMLFVFSIQMPAGLALYWVISNIFQVVQQYVILNSSKKPKEELK